MGDPGVDGRVVWLVIKWIFVVVGSRCMDWVELAQDRDRCQALVNAVMNLRFP